MCLYLHTCVIDTRWVIFVDKVQRTYRALAEWNKTFVAKYSMYYNAPLWDMSHISCYLNGIPHTALRCTDRERNYGACKSLKKSLGLWPHTAFCCVFEWSWGVFLYTNFIEIHCTWNVVIAVIPWNAPWIISPMEGCGLFENPWTICVGIR